MNRRMGIGHQSPGGIRLPEQFIGPGSMGQAKVDDLAVVSQFPDGLHGGIRLKLGTVVMGKMEGHQSCTHKSSHPV